MLNMELCIHTLLKYLYIYSVTDAELRHMQCLIWLHYCECMWECSIRNKIFLRHVHLAPTTHQWI
uniref:Uncharacterized protein n=1 Tax=Anguilla anguilla TaxID=7936 RepID=A0A0E9SE79_ANGAN